VTIIGAISQEMKIVFHHVTYSTNKETVEDFYKKFHRKFKLKEKVIVMDNHRAHGANVVRDFLDENEAIIEFLPPCSSYFNPIETVWAWVKGKWKNSLLQTKDLNESHQEWIRGELSRICASCPE
jgi:transposase